MPTNIYLWSNFKLIIGRLFGFGEGWGIQKAKDDSTFGFMLQNQWVLYLLHKNETSSKR